MSTCNLVLFTSVRKPIHSTLKSWSPSHYSSSLFSLEPKPKQFQNISNLFTFSCLHINLTDGCTSFCSRVAHQTAPETGGFGPADAKRHACDSWPATSSHLLYTTSAAMLDFPFLSRQSCASALTVLRWKLFGCGSKLRLFHLKE